MTSIAPSPVAPHNTTTITTATMIGSQKRKRSESTSAAQSTPSASPLSPSLYIANLYAEQGLRIQAARDQSYFVQPTAEMIESYDKDVLQAVRHKDIEALRSLHENGKSLQCCNRFGESLIHMACRNGLAEIVKFLVKEANVSLFVRDDYGRTPAHDACWTVKPNVELMEFLIEEAPELLGLSDVRGHTPFSYSRKNHWGEWVEFLDKRKELLIPNNNKKAKFSSTSLLPPINAKQ